MKEKILLEKYLLYTRNLKYKSYGILLEDLDLDNYIEKLNSLDILVVEIEKLDLNIKKIIQKIKKRFRNCKILILVPEMNTEIENFIIEFSIDAYLTFPILPFQLLRSLYCLNEF